MRSGSFLLFLLIYFVSVQGQQRHFIYIQTENKQAFYTRLNEKVFSSTASGYLIIPKLNDGTHQLSIGFPQNEWPPQNIEVIINKRDEGFLLKNFGEKGWGLFNTRLFNILLPATINNVNNKVPEVNADGFSNVLAEVTNTPARQSPALLNPNTANDSIKSTIVKKEMFKDAISIEKALPILPVNQVTKVFSYFDSSGRSIIYTATEGNDADTIRLFIPYPSTQMTVEKELVDSVSEQKLEGKDASTAFSKREANLVKDSSANIIAAVANEPLKPVENAGYITDVKISEVNTDKRKEYSITVINPACKAMATEKDFSKLQKKIAAAGTEDDMIAAASKSFRSICFTTDQLKNLSLLFLQDKGKYNFFDAAYSHVSDPGNFKDLQSQLTDEYYITRFKAMLH